MIFAAPLADILKCYAKVDVLVLGDVTYGACCVDDLTAGAMGCDFLVHFAHSCLVPISEMVPSVKVMYVFVDIKFDVWHLVETVKANVHRDKTIAIAATIQFVSSIHGAAKELIKDGFGETKEK